MELPKIVTTPTSRMTSNASNSPYSLSLPVPPEATQSLDFDPDTNGQLATGLLAQWDRLRLNAGVLTRDGVVVTINPDGPAGKDAKMMTQIRALLDADTALSAAQLRAILRFILRRIT